MSEREEQSDATSTNTWQKAREALLVAAEHAAKRYVERGDAASLEAAANAYRAATGT